MTFQEGRIQLRDKLLTMYGESEAGNIADWVMEKLTGTRRNDRILAGRQELNEVQSLQLQNAKTRLLSHEPVQYVLGEAWFCGMKFYVDKNVLIPRPETEELVEWVISNLKFPIDKLKILDIGSGSGCIAIALKRKLRKAQVWSCDISENALKVARYNADTLGAEVHFLQVDFLQPAERASLPEFDIITSNPPYIPENDKTKMQRNVLDFEPHTALFVPDNDPLIFYRAIADFARQHLNKQGSLFLELHEDFAYPVKALFDQAGYSTEMKTDMQGKERMLLAKHKP